MKKRLLFTFFMCAFIAALHAQVTTASISGKVVSADEPIIGATIQALHEPSGTMYGAVTNIDGRFSIQGMRTGGPYKVTVSYIGYKTSVINDIVLKLGENFQVDVTMQEATELLGEVVVVASRSKLGTDRVGGTSNITNKDINLLPSINRSISDFTRLSPYSGAGKSFGGHDGRLNNVTIDGANFNNNMGLTDNLPGGGNPISMDAIEEMQVTVAPFDVRQANFVGAGINVITKSGTNTFKGTAYTYIQNQDMRGNKVDGVYLGTPSEEKTNIYGFTLGGPIIKNKLFFFVNGEIEDSPGQITEYRVSGTGNGLESRTKAEHMDAFAKTLRDTYGYNSGSYTDFPGGTDNKKFLARLDWNINEAHKLTLRYNYTKGMTWNAPNATSAPYPRASGSSGRISLQSMAFSNNAYSMDNQVSSYAGELNSRFGKNLQNQLLVTYTNIQDMRGSNSSIFPHIDIWAPNDASADYSKNIEDYDAYKVANYDQYMSAGYELFTYNNGVKNNILNIMDNVTYTIGSHKLTAGISYENQFLSNAYMRYGTGYYRWRSLEDFQTGQAPVVFGLTYGYDGNPDPAGEVRFAKSALYLQDDWNINDNLKLSYGLRADMTQFLNKLSENKRLSELEFRDGEKVNNGLWPKTRVQLSPRANLTWDVYGDKSLTISYGAGLFTGRIPVVYLTNMPQNSGMIQNQIEISTYYSNLFPTNQSVKDYLMPLYQGGKWATNVQDMVRLLNLPTTVDGVDPKTVSNMSVVDRNFKMPQMFKTSLSVDYRLPISFPMNLRFEGMYSKDIDAVYQDNINMIGLDGLDRFSGPDNRYRYPKNSMVNDKAPKVLPVLRNTSEGYGYTLNFLLTAQPVENMSAMVSYTYTVVKELSGNPGNAPVSAWQGLPSINGPNNATLQNSQYVTPHKLIGSLTYRFPTKNAWEGTTVGLYYTGYHAGNFTFMYANDMNGDGIGYDQIYIPANKNDIQFKDANGFTAAEQADAFWKFVEQDPYLKNHKGQYAEAYSARMPWVNRFDLKLAKEFYVNIGKQKNTLQISLDVLNVGNILNSSWGATKMLTSGAGTPLRYEGMDSSNKPVFSMNTYTVDKVKHLITDTFQYRNETSNCWQLQVGVRYIFN